MDENRRKEFDKKLTVDTRKEISLESQSGNQELYYACLLVPRYSTHYLTGDLAEKLSEWLPGICSSYVWQLEYLAVRPDYLQWIVSVPPNTSPGYLMRILRRETSEKILSTFPNLSKENPANDFWAPGYLIMGGPQPHPVELIRDYIKQTRRRQETLTLAGDETTDAPPPEDDEKKKRKGK